MENESLENFDKSNFDKEATEKIDAVQTFDELFDVLRKIELVQGSTRVYPAELLIKQITSLREMAHVSSHLYLMSISGITRGYNLRSKVEELMFKELPQILQLIKEEQKEEQRADLREQYYQKKLEEEFSFDVGGELFVDVSNQSVKEKVEKMFESKVYLLGDLSPEDIFKDEDLLILKVQEIILSSLSAEGSVTYDDVQQSLEFDQMMFDANSPSLTKYALRKGWEETKSILNNL